MAGYRFAYYSRVRKGLTKNDLKQILEASRKNNAANRISGALCYNDGYFIQVIEGERDRLNFLLRRLLTDERHSEFNMIGAEPYEKRVFTKWAMAFVDQQEFTKKVCKRYCGTDEFKPEVLDLRAATLLAHALMVQ